jgi:hypothetical protein
MLRWNSFRSGADDREHGALFYEELSRRLPTGVSLRRIRIWEAPTYSSSFGMP